MDYPRAKSNVHNHAKLVELMTAAPMSAEVYAAVQRKRTESRRLIEDMRIAAQAVKEQSGQYGALPLRQSSNLSCATRTFRDSL